MNDLQEALNQGQVVADRVGRGGQESSSCVFEICDPLPQLLHLERVLREGISKRGCVSGLDAFGL